MKLAEFKHQLSTHNLKLEETIRYYIVKNFDFETVCKVSKNKQFVVDTDYDEYSKLSFDTQESLFPILSRFSATPIEDRKDSIYQLTIYLKNENILIFKSPTNFNFEFIYNWFYMTSSYDCSTPIFTNETDVSNRVELYRSTIQSMTLEEL